MMEFDSDDEKYFSWWCEELKEAGIIASFSRGQSYVLNKALTIEREHKVQLVTKVKTSIKKHRLITSKVYTPDFEIYFNLNNCEKLLYVLHSLNWDIEAPIKGVVDENTGKGFAVIEVKPIFDQNNMTRLFKTNQAFMFERHGIYVNLIIYQELFDKTFTPMKYILEEGFYKKDTLHGKKGDNKIKWTVRTLEQFLK